MLHVLMNAQVSDETQHDYMNSSQGIRSLTEASTTRYPNLRLTLTSPSPSNHVLGHI